MTLQLHYDIAEIKRRQTGTHPDLNKLAVIKRVFERGNEIEKGI